jgi:hypothetical protein
MMQLGRYNTIYHTIILIIPKRIFMDDLVILSVGKLYIENTRLTRIVELLQARISELEAQINQPPLSNPVVKDGGKT